MYIKITFGGVSRNDFDYIRHFDESMGGVDTLQIDYSFLTRRPEQDALPYCQEHKIGVIVRGPLAMGKLTGKFTEETTFPEGDIRRGWTAPEHKTSFIKDLERAEKLRFLTNGRTMSQAAESKLSKVVSHNYILIRIHIHGHKTIVITHQAYLKPVKNGNTIKNL